MSVLVRSLIGVFLTVSFLTTSCTKKNNQPPLITPKANGKVAQSSQQEVPQTRLHFAFDQKGFRFLGREKVSSFATVNPISLPKELYAKYQGFVLVDSDNNSLFEIIKKNLIHFESEFHSDYSVYQYKGYFFLDVPDSVELSKVVKLGIQNLETQQMEYVIAIDDIERIHVPKNEENDWDGKYKVFKVLGDDTPESSYDVVILADGFSRDEISLASKSKMFQSVFGKKLKDLVLPAFQTEPFVSMSNNLNVWVVATASTDSGADLPSEGVFKKTIFDSTFDTYCSRRSLTVKNQERALQMAAKTPFDQIIVMVNSDIYGGQGSDISTFSLNERATYLIRHELGHSIGLLADEYSFFSDKENQTDCEDTQIVQYAYHKHKTWGRNRLFDKDNLLAPNLTLHSNVQDAKWSYLLDSKSPIIYFDYPTDYNKITFSDPNSMTVSSNYQLQHNQKDLILMFGPKDNINEFTRYTQSVSINGQPIDFSLVKTKHLYFIKTKSTKFEQGDKLNVVIRLKSDKPFKEGRESYYSSSQHFLTIASDTFAGGSEIGLFQGAIQSMTEVFRSSYNSIMNGGDEFDQLQIDSYVSLMEYYK